MNDIKSGLVKVRPFIRRVPKFQLTTSFPHGLSCCGGKHSHSTLSSCSVRDRTLTHSLMSWSVPKEKVPELPRHHLFKVTLWLLTVLRLYMSLVVQKAGDAQDLLQPSLFQATKRGKKLSWRVAWVDGSAFPSVFHISSQVFHLMKCHKCNKSRHLSFFPFSLTLLPFLGNIFSSFPIQY